mmetsp:Transcript_54249/g.89815  ORF Transcript_54249/g.89815 Transcript_54249/m.89815 type:complete len:208 (-) Transcript_54249:1163-1786(-)
MLIAAIVIHPCFRQFGALNLALFRDRNIHFDVLRLSLHFGLALRLPIEIQVQVDFRTNRLVHRNLAIRGTLLLAQSHQSRRQVHFIAQHRVLATRPCAAHQTQVHDTRSDTNRDLMLGAITLQPDTLHRELVAQVERRHHCAFWIITMRDGRQPKHSHHRRAFIIDEELVERALVLVDHLLQRINNVLQLRQNFVGKFSKRARIPWQ